MKILLTGEPHSGKSTLLAKLIAATSDIQGFLTEEIQESGHRAGFRLVSSDGRAVELASIHSNSQVRLSRYGIDLKALEDFLRNAPEVKQGSLLYIDEIGQMQLMSEAFKKVARGYLESENDLVGTISKIYHDEFTDWVRALKDVEIVEVTPENRDELTEELIARVRAI